MPDAYELANGNYVRLEHLTAKELRQCLTEWPSKMDQRYRKASLRATLINAFDWSGRRVDNFVERYET